MAASGCSESIASDDLRDFVDDLLYFFDSSRRVLVFAEIDLPRFEALPRPEVVLFPSVELFSRIVPGTKRHGAEVAQHRSWIPRVVRCRRETLRAPLRA